MFFDRRKWSHLPLMKPRIEWVVWLFPAFALAIAGYLFFQFLQTRGPLIKIYFEDAANLEAEQTPIKYRGITVGHVETIELSQNSKKVLVKARLVSSARKLAVEGTQFWIVEPQVSFEGVRGLETIFKGSYIRLQPGQKGNKEKNTFVGKEGVDLSSKTSGMITYHLTTPRVESISSGDAVTYRGLKIGAVSEVELGRHSQYVDVLINVERRYVKLVRTNTVFWVKKALKADLGLFGSNIEIGSLENMIKGGIALATPDKPGKIANAGHSFSLQNNAPQGRQSWTPEL